MISALNEHDYDRFMKYFEKYGGDQLPAMAAVFHNVNDDYRDGVPLMDDHIDITLNLK